MSLSWSHATEIAAALLKEHPDADRLSLRHEHLVQLVTALPAFSDTPTPPKPLFLDHILWTWMRLAEDSFSERGAA